MNINDFQDYLSQQKQISPYASYLESSFYQLDEQKQNFFLNEVARSDMDPKIMMGLAKFVMQGKDPSGIRDLSYYDLARYDANMLPNIQIHQSINYEKEVQDVIDQYVKGPQNNFFCQTNNSTENTAYQGWKFHVAADSLEDYARLCKTLVPDLQRNGVLYKVVRPERFEDQMHSDQIGKAITIYAGPGFDMKKLSPESRAILDEPTQTQVYGDANISGRVFARYGSFYKAHCITTPDGQIIPDPKTERKACPDFVEFNKDAILNFYSDNEQRLAVSGDYRAYLQEREIMARCDGSDYAYMSFAIKPEDIEKIKSSIRTCDKQTSLSHITCHDAVDINGQIQKEYLLMIHKSSMINDFGGMDCPLLQDLASKGIELNRPEWDFKGAAYIIPESRKFEVEQLCEKDNCELAFVGTTEDGVTYVQCDIMLIDVLKNELENNIKIPFAAYDRDSELEIKESIDALDRDGYVGEFNQNDYIEPERS